MSEDEVRQIIVQSLLNETDDEDDAQVAEILLVSSLLNDAD